MRRATPACPCPPSRLYDHDATCPAAPAARGAHATLARPRPPGKSDEGGRPRLHRRGVPRPHFEGPRHAFVGWLAALEGRDPRAAALARRELLDRHGIDVRLSARREGGRP
jgi:hypothetical protein